MVRAVDGELLMLAQLRISMVDYSGHGNLYGDFQQTSMTATIPAVVPILSPS